MSATDEPLLEEEHSAMADALEPAPADEAPGEVLPGSSERDPAPFAPLDFVSVEMLLPSTNPVLVLRERDGSHRELHVPIGVPEGVAIAYGARHIGTPRPLTHELFTNVLEQYGLTLEAVRITSVEGASYSAEIVLSGALGIRVLPCRLSDGVCLALRQRLEVPVIAAASVLDQAGFDSSVS